ncbi:MAG: heme-binding beta-barrel domain-containing protein [Chitinophagales bacterium]|nr:heme-binding beta-barrel domain-containing protein [Chitinophagales bacterium]
MAKRKVLGPQRLGPLTPLVGEWEGNVGVDVSYHNDDEITGKTTYYEKAWFKPIPTQTNGKQKLEGLFYKSTAWRHGEEAMEPFHDEAGFLLWDKINKQVIRTVVFGRGIAIQAGATAEAQDDEINFKATIGDPAYGILQNKYLLENAELRSFESTFKFNNDGSFTHSSEIVLKLSAMGGEEMKHTDINTLQRIKSYHVGGDDK